MKIYLENLNGVCDEIKKHFDLVPLRKAERVVLWSDFLGPHIQIIRQSRVPVIHIQGGRMDGDVLPFEVMYNKFPLLCDRICVWGTEDVRDLLKAGVPKEKIFLTGTTTFGGLYKKPHKDFTVVFLACHDIEAAGDNERITSQLKKTPYRVITKITDGQPPEKFINPVASNRYARNHLKICAEVLAQCDVVLSNFKSTFEFMALYLKIPVVRSVEEIASAKFNELETRKLLWERGQYEGALERMIKVIKD